MQIEPTTLVELFKNPELFLDFSEAQQSRVIIILRQQKILARLAYFLSQNELTQTLPAKTQRHLNNALNIAQRQKEQVLTEALNLQSLLSSESDYIVFLKGAAYSLSDSLVGKGRVYSDIDILVTKHQINACEQKLLVHGWIGEELNDYDDKYYRKWAHEIPPLLHSSRGTVIDVHHNIIPLISKDAPSVEALAKYISFNHIGVQVLSAHAQFVHSAVHLFRNEDYQTSFRDILDLYLMWIEGQAESQQKPYNESFQQGVQNVAHELGFAYELGLAYSSMAHIFGLNLHADAEPLLRYKSHIRVAFDRFVFYRVLWPQHELMQNKANTIVHFLSVLRGHCVKMPLHLLGYHLFVKSMRGIVKTLFGKHVFAPKDEFAEKKKY